VNRFELKGAIYGEPRLYGSGEKTVCKALVKAEKSFINVTAFAEMSRILHSHAKGEDIHCEGRVQSGSYEKEGKKIYTQDLVIEKIYGVTKKNDIEDWMR
jgi:single-stranded DNA-binding protein